MKVRTIFRGAVAGLMSVSLLMSGMPVMATGTEAAGQQTEAEGETADAASQQKPSDGNAESKPQETNIDGTAAETENSQENADEADAGEGKDTQTKSDAGKTEETETEAETGENSQSKTEAEEGKDTQTKSDAGKAEETGTDEEKEKGAETGTDEEKEKGAETGTDAEEGKNTKQKKAKSGEDAQTQNEDVPQAFSLNQLTTVEGSIAIDGDLSDWAGVTERTTNIANVDSWKVAYSTDGNTLYFCYTGSASTEWDYNFGSNSFNFTYPDGVTGQSSSVFINAWKGGAVVKNAWWGDVPGTEIVVANEAHGNNAGPYRVEFSVPVSFFHSTDFTLAFGDASISSGDIEQINGNAVVQDTPAVYTGITIDGNYSDWAAVAKADASCPNEQHPGCLSQVAAVYDGDWFYIYIRDGEGSNASGAGTHSNGKFAITSDLGYETDIQLSTAPAVSGVDGAQISYVGSEWEIAIPKSQLPKYENSLSFGFYLGDVLVGDIVNLQPDSGNNLENLFNGIIYDGQYEDWEDYGHTTIEYATAGSQEAQVDAKGALYSDGEKLYGHVVTSMPQHLQEAGGEFTSAVTIAFNQRERDLRTYSYNTSEEMMFYPRYVAVDGNGNINWNPQLSGLAEGTYEYYIASVDAWHTSTNINNLNEMDQLYGKMMMTVGKDGKDEMEFYLELPMIAQKLGVDETDLKEISAQFGRIGQQWIYTAGTSTGPAAGVILCVASVGLVFWYRKKKTGEILFPAVG